MPIPLVNAGFGSFDPFPQRFRIRKVPDLERHCFLPRRTQNGHISRATGDHGRSSPSPSNKLICWASLPSDDLACPPVPRSGLMKEILGKGMGL